MTRLRHESGVTLIELLVSMSLSLFILGATLTAFESLQDEHRTTAEHNDAADVARTSIDRLARDLRNLASPTALRNARENRPRAVELAEADDLVFRIVDETAPPAGTQNAANVMRVRYCLDTSNTGNQVLWSMTQRWTTATPPPTFPDTSACPGGGWAEQRRLSTNLVNVRPGVSRPVFTYDSTQVEQIARVRAELFVDPTPTRRPTEARLATGVILRNQNRFPEAVFTQTIVRSELAPDGTRLTVINLDASASTDNEGQPLRYCWFVDPPVPTPDCPPPPPSDGSTPPAPPASFIGEGVVLSHRMRPGAHRIVLQVEDPAGLRDEAEETRTY